jgi:hypothetical protein
MHGGAPQLLHTSPWRVARNYERGQLHTTTEMRHLLVFFCRLSRDNKRKVLVDLKKKRKCLLLKIRKKYSRLKVECSSYKAAVKSLPCSTVIHFSDRELTVVSIVT